MTCDKKTKVRRLTLSVVLGAGVLLVALPVFASIFGEENVTLTSILAELIDSGSTLADISDTASKVADSAEELLQIYQRANAAIDQFRNYSFDALLSDVQNDLYRQYPGFAKLEYATENFEKWRGSYSVSPFTAYQAIGAVAADVSAPLRRDVEARRTTIDRELLLASEASTGFAVAQTAEEASKIFSEKIDKLGAEAKDASPAHAQQIAAQASILLLEQQSHVMKLLSRVVRTGSVSETVDFGHALAARNAPYEHRDLLVGMANEALQPPALLTFGAP
jgi:hypothetical protein